MRLAEMGRSPSWWRACRSARATIILGLDPSSRPAHTSTTVPPNPGASERQRKYATGRWRAVRVKRRVKLRVVAAQTRLFGDAQASIERLPLAARMRPRTLDEI